MLQKQWLLIGGAGHGQTIWIKSANVVICPNTAQDDFSGDGINKPAAQSYQGVNYILNGSVFQIGIHNPTPDQELQIPALIAESKLKPFKSQ